MDMPLKRAVVADAVRHNNKVRKEWASAQGKLSKRSRIQQLNLFVQQAAGASASAIATSATVDVVNSSTNNTNSSQHPRGMVTAIGTGVGGHVHIPRFRLTGVMDVSVDAGQVVSARVKKIDPDSGQIYLSLL